MLLANSTIPDALTEKEPLTERPVRGDWVLGRYHFVHETNTPSTEPLLELLWRASNDSDPAQSDAAFATDLLVENSEQDLSSPNIALLGALQRPRHA